MSKSVYVFPHTHWDREWYFTIEESRSLLMHDLEEILTHLEKNPEFGYFVLDGQSIVVEDYLKTRPQDEDRIRALSQAGRLKLGPWLTQTDSQVVSAESMVRNLVYGIEIAERVGPAMRMGYIPDSFGQTASLPTLLNGFGMDSVVFWRGKTERHAKDVNFLWRGADGSQVNATNIAQGYQVAKYLESDPDTLQARMQKILDRLGGNSASDNVLLPAGHDQMPIQKNLPSLLKNLEQINPGDSYRISTIEDYFADTFADTSGLEVYEGEFTEGKYMRVHRSIYSTRMDIKMLNASCEAELTQMLEPLLSVASHLGLDYSQSLVAEAWKTILQCHAHDSIGCCNSDRVNADIKHRFVKAGEIIRAHAKMTLRLMAASIEKRDDEDLLLVFNAIPSGGTRLVEQELFVGTRDFAILDTEDNEVPYSLVEIEDYDAQKIDRQIAHLNQHIPMFRAVITFNAEFDGLGYTSYRIVPGRVGTVVATRTSAATKIEGDALSAEVTADGIRLVRRDGTEIQVKLEESGDEGDGYDYSPPPVDLVLEDFVFEAKGVTIVQGAHRIAFTAQRQVPASLEERTEGATSILARFEGTVELRDGEDFARIHLSHDNSVDNHRFRLKAVTGVTPEYSIANNQFGVIKRELEHPEAERFVELGWAEKPIPVYPMMSFCAVTQGDAGAFVATKGLREYEVTGADHGELSVTLYRSVGDIGKDDLTRRPGRASGIKVPAPDSQLHQHLEFDLAVGFLAGEKDIVVASRAAHRINTVDCTFQVKKHNDFQLNPTEKRIPSTFSWFSLDDSVVLSTVKMTESGAGYAARFFNPSMDEVSLETPELLGYVAHLGRLDERVGDRAPGGQLVVPSCGTITLIYLPE
ncbi:glycoside hydrolase family 38 C-terminal domain-containing protein [Cryobacterium sp. Y11]|uniref:glycoside hydrolase family 38 N-terminal domain-containing protein n=1 Tax=Cryobacterium sp. Y11 TaxID=2045016 RepID=UPI000CE482B9|nr:glycoside hydrolase family 38 C-terminal domain-containing protein [Cryobacterium sp. Y11]